MVMAVAGGIDVLNNFFYAPSTENDVRMYQQNINSLHERMNTGTITSTFANFYNNVVDQIRTIDFETVKDFTRSVGRKVFGFWENDTAIIPLNTLADLQFPPQNMIRWLMANPVVRQKYHQKLVAGYDDKYTDLEPGLVGEDQHDYRMVMNGMEYEDEEGEICYTTYDETFDDCPEESVDKLSLSERLDIVDAWDLTNKYLELMQDDPTSQYSGML